MSTNHFYISDIELDDKSILEYITDMVLKNQVQACNHVCFGSIYMHLNEESINERFYVGLNVTKKTAERFAEGFNKFFNNIKMEIVCNINYQQYANDYDSVWVINNEISNLGTGRHAKKLKWGYECTIFTLNFSADYSGHSKYVIYPIIGELLRLFIGVDNFEYAHARYNKETGSYDYTNVRDLVKDSDDLFIKSFEIDQLFLANCFLVKAKLDELKMIDSPKFMNDLFEDEFQIYSEQYKRYTVSYYEKLIYPTIVIESIQKKIKEKSKCQTMHVFDLYVLKILILVMLCGILIV